MRPIGTSRQVLFWAGLLACASMPFLLGADDPAEANRKKIESMSKIERDRLEAKYELYRSLSEEEREKFRQFHANIQADPKLKQMLEKYSAWLDTLSVWQRDELRRETDPAKRLELVRQFREEQSEEDSPLGRESDSRYPRLTPEDMEAAMRVVQDSLEISPQRAQELEAMPAYKRQMSILYEALSQHFRSGRPPRSRWPSDALVDEIVSVLTDYELKENLLERDANDRRGTLIWRIRSAMYQDLQREWNRHEPSDEQLQELFVELEPKLRYEIMLKRPEDAKRKLSWLYYEHNHEDLIQVKRERDRVLWSLNRRPGERGRPGGSRSPGDRSRSDDDRNRDDDRDDDRDRDDERDRSRRGRSG